MILILGGGYALVGLALTLWAAPLSVRYNAWTTGLRERHPTRIMTVIFRVMGLFLVPLSILTVTGKR